jgi:ferritin-like metal-binding protein YciE
LLQSSERVLARSLESVAKRHRDQPSISAMLMLLARWSNVHVEKLDPIVKRYPGASATSPQILSSVLFKGPRKGSIGFLRDLQDLSLLAHAVHGNWTVIDQVAAATRDDDMKALCDAHISETMRQLEWMDTRIKEVAPQVLTVPQ